MDGMPDIRDAQGLLRVVQQTCYSGGNPDYARIEQLVEQYSSLFTLPQAVDNFLVEVAKMKHISPSQRNQLLTHHRNFIKRTLSYQEASIRAKRTNSAREKYRIRERLKSFSPEYTPQELGTVESNFGRSIDQRTAQLPSEDNLRSQRQLLDLYVDALMATEQV